MIVPMVNAIYLSFTSSTALSVGFNSKFVLFDNYKYMFQDKNFLQALLNTLKLMLVIPAVTIFLSWGEYLLWVCVHDFRGGHGFFTCPENFQNILFTSVPVVMFYPGEY